MGNWDLVPKFLGMGNMGGGFFPKVDEKYGDEDREYNWWGCPNSPKLWRFRADF